MRKVPPGLRLSSQTHIQEAVKKKSEPKTQPRETDRNGRKSIFKNDPRGFEFKSVAMNSRSEVQKLPVPKENLEA